VAAVGRRWHSSSSSCWRSASRHPVVVVGDRAVRPGAHLVSKSSSSGWAGQEKAMDEIEAYKKKRIKDALEANGAGAEIGATECTHRLRRCTCTRSD